MTASVEVALRRDPKWLWATIAAWFRRLPPSHLDRTTDIALQALADLPSYPGLSNGGSILETELVQAAPQQLQHLGVAYLRGQRVLYGHDRQLLLKCVQEGLEVAVRSLRSGRPPLATNALAALQDRVTYVTRFVERREEEVSRRRYALGLLGGVVLSLMLLTVIGLVAPAIMRSWIALGSSTLTWATASPATADILALRDTLVAIGGGAAGAAVSVLLRLHRVGRLNWETVNTGAATYRIFLGWFFAAALVFLVKGGIADSLITDPSAELLTHPDDTALLVSSWFYWG